VISMLLREGNARPDMYWSAVGEVARRNW
jgi:hypothetical protein